MAWLPDFEDVIEIHYGLVELFLDDEDPVSPPGPRDENLVHSACARPMTGMGTVDKYPDDFQKMAALFHSLTQNHAFHNGNKRTALVSLLAALYRNGRVFSYELSDDEIYEMTVSVAEGKFLNIPDRLSPDVAVEKIGHWLRRNTISRNQSASEMHVSDFVSRCQSIGCIYKEQGGYHHLANGENSIRLNLDTRRIAGNAAKTYLRRLVV